MTVTMTEANIPDEPYAGRLNLPAGPDGTAPIVTDEANEGLRDGDLARTDCHMLLVGKTGGGKGRDVLIPNIVRWGPRPVVAMSSKADLAEATIRKRSERGPVYLLDLSGEVREEQLRGVDVRRIRVDPCTVIRTDDDAMNMASLLMQIGDIGAGGGDSGGDSAFWKSLARRRLACFLLAGGHYIDPATGKRRWGGGIAWALDAAENVGEDAAESTGGVGVTAEGLEDDPDELVETPPDLETPSWSAAYLRCYQRDSRHAASLLAARKMDERQRDSIGINCQVAMSAWAMETVASDSSVKAFDPSFMTAPGATLYIVSGMEGAGPPAVAALLIGIVQYWRLRVDELPSILFVLDEFANGSRIPARYINQWISEGRGLGIRMLLALQTTKQLDELWGKAAADVTRAIVPAALILPGAGETEMLRSAAESTPPEERSVTALDAGGRASQSRQMVQVTPAELLPRRRGEARLLRAGMAGVAVRLRDVSATNLLD